MFSKDSHSILKRIGVSKDIRVAWFKALALARTFAVVVKPRDIILLVNNQMFVLMASLWFIDDW